MTVRDKDKSRSIGRIYIHPQGENAEMVWPRHKTRNLFQSHPTNTTFGRKKANSGKYELIPGQNGHL